MRWVALVGLLLACGARTSLGDGHVIDAGGGAPIDAKENSFEEAGPDVLTFGPVLAPRAISPLSTQSTTSRRPLFRWVLPNGVEGARVEICADRACAKPESSFDAIGASGKAPSDLEPGLHFYRLRGISNQTIGETTDATREFVVPRRSAPRDAAWGAFPDLDGDGYADAIATGRSGQFPNVVQAPITVFPGSSSGIHHKSRVEIPWTDFVVDLAVAGDVDGDGLVDVVVVVSEALTSSPTTALVLLRGAPSSKMLAAPVTIQTLTGGKSFTRVAAAGDVNGDGYADVLVNEEDAIADTGEVRIRYGGPNGLALGPIVATFQTPFASRAVELGDLDGDGIGDIAIGSHASIDIVLGSGAGPGSPTSLAACANAILSRTPGDLDGDGIPDLAALSSCGFGVFYGGAKTWSILSKPTGFPSLGSSFAIAGDVDGDGYDDLVSSLGSLAGMLSYGSPTGASDANRVVFSAPHASQGIVAAAGDLDRDGYMDLLLGETENAFNWLYTFVGTPNGPSQETIVSPLDNGAWAEHTIIR